MNLPDILEAENLGRLRLIGPVGNTVIDDDLEGNLREWECRRPSHELTGEYAQVRAAGHLEDRLARLVITTTEKSDQADATVPS